LRRCRGFVRRRRHRSILFFVLNNNSLLIFCAYFLCGGEKNGLKSPFFCFLRKVRDTKFSSSEEEEEEEEL
jgi:hypothetical protein